ncbi:MAG: D,D-heptose 1,7-bisphosphate phosphatase [Acidobacteria bacterium]|nr:MAG: D,D-heptose 1,7-bisphosphate phosphatase [Acidobacteriota bacterium]
MAGNDAPEPSNRAVFLDRDGTVSEEVGYVNHIERLRLYPFSAAAVRRLNEAGLRTVVVTNQSGVARGYFPEALVAEVHARLVAELAAGGARLDAIYYCPHHPEARVASYRKECDCRKPKVGMLQRAARELSVDLSRSFVVGDRYRDLEPAFRTGAFSILVLSGYGRGEYAYGRATWPRAPDHVAENLLDAAGWILGRLEAAP